MKNVKKSWKFRLIWIKCKDFRADLRFPETKIMYTGINQRSLLKLKFHRFLGDLSLIQIIFPKKIPVGTKNEIQFSCQYPLLFQLVI